MSNNCVFCKIVRKELPSYTLYEDDIVKVFLNINPDSMGHALIIPKKHYLDIMDIPDDILNHINIISKKIYLLLKEKLNFEGLRIQQNNGCLQEIKHYHLHLIPFYHNGESKTVNEVYEIIKK